MIMSVMMMMMMMSAVRTYLLTKPLALTSFIKQKKARPETFLPPRYATNRQPVLIASIFAIYNRLETFKNDW